MLSKLHNHIDTFRILLCLNCTKVIIILFYYYYFFFCFDKWFNREPSVFFITYLFVIYCYNVNCAYYSVKVLSIRRALFFETIILIINTRKMLSSSSIIKKYNLLILRLTVKSSFRIKKKNKIFKLYSFFSLPGYWWKFNFEKSYT